MNTKNIMLSLGLNALTVGAACVGGFVAWALAWATIGAAAMIMLNNNGRVNK